jgi:hypothetical protein
MPSSGTAPKGQEETFKARIPQAQNSRLRPLVGFATSIDELALRFPHGALCVIRRRELIAGLGAAAWPLAALAQRRPAMPVIGYVTRTLSGSWQASTGRAGT